MCKVDIQKVLSKVPNSDSNISKTTSTLLEAWAVASLGVQETLVTPSLDKPFVTCPMYYVAIVYGKGHSTCEEMISRI